MPVKDIHMVSLGMLRGLNWNSAAYIDGKDEARRIVENSFGRMPDWAFEAGWRMANMGVKSTRIYEILVEMEKSRRAGLREGKEREFTHADEVFAKALSEL